MEYLFLVDCTSVRLQKSGSEKGLIPQSQTSAMMFVNPVGHCVCNQTHLWYWTGKPLNEIKISRFASLLNKMQSPSMASETVPWGHLNLADTCKASATSGMSSFSNLNSALHSLESKKSSENGSNSQ